ncbi:Sensor protein QseC [Roseivivax sp. THAF40]|uniref:sensor histidine kinase n=1 Tax=Roseivivax sp. THAF40 TaxID=2587858 RepID=UPI00126806BF|nr:sensor histidine kinase [Roseivivax sp. THAF40]QFT45397.1 Sensor protein QseC [Roseivivax sp. THAF40]
MTALSLRARLFLLILAPLLVVSVLLGIWRYEVAKRTAEDLFDRSLLSAALAISRDVTISEGDALSPSTREIVSDAGGGEIFYHVTGPGGIYVTGYAYPPNAPGSSDSDEPAYFLADYRDERVRVLRMSETVSIGTMTGQAVVTVWQRLSDRAAFAATLAQRAAGLMAVLMLALAFVVWFGVQVGLRPLRDLQNAIEQRSPDDLRRIKRPVPVEVAGIVGTLNRLFGQVARNIETHQSFISDAAHQLRNPASALLSLAETMPDIQDPKDRERHQRDLIKAARKSARLAEQLLSLERLRFDGPRDFATIDLNDVAAQACSDLGPAILSRDLSFELVQTPEPLRVQGDAVLLGEAITNLIENALQHGGPELTAITVRTSKEDKNACVTIEDDGRGLPMDMAALAFRRFGQLEAGSGSGLGLAIVDNVAHRHDGEVHLLELPRGTAIQISIPSA